MFNLLASYSANPLEDQKKLLERIVFNYLIGNTDCHIKNYSLLYSENLREIRLAPAYDMTYAYNPQGAWTGMHQMTFNGKRSGFVLDDFKAVAKFAGLRQGRYKKILAEVEDAVHQWSKLAKQNDIPARIIHAIEKTHEFME